LEWAGQGITDKKMPTVNWFKVKVDKETKVIDVYAKQPFQKVKLLACFGILDWIMMHLPLVDIPWQLNSEFSIHKLD
jgi:hypothetical protein